MYNIILGSFTRLANIIICVRLNRIIKRSCLRTFFVGAAKSSMTSSGSKTGPPNLPLGVPPLLPNQYGIPMAPGLMPAYTVSWLENCQIRKLDL